MLLRDLQDLLYRVEDNEMTASLNEMTAAVTTLDLASIPLQADMLASMIDVQDRIPERARFSHGHDYLHVSALVDLCPRQYVVAHRTGADVSQVYRGAMRVVFVMGLAAERHVCAQVAAHIGTDSVTVGLELVEPDYRIVGRPDLVLHVERMVPIIAEVKSMNARQFAGLEAPLADHVLQTLLYRWLYARLRGPVHDHVVLLYVCKDFVARGSPYKEFHVDAGSTQSTIMLDRALDLAVEWRNARDSGTLPRRICEDQSCTRARSCPVATACFNMPEGV